MSCDDHQISVTNQDPFPLLLTISSDEVDETKVYEVPGARLDDETNVYVPTTTKVCLKDAPEGKLTVRYTHGNKCIHRVFPVEQWSTSGFTYTVPAWNYGNPGEVCRVPENSNGNKNSAANHNDGVGDDDDDTAPGNSNDHWWRWFWRRQGMKRINTTHMAAMSAVAFVVLVSLVWYLLSRRRRA